MASNVLQTPDVLEIDAVGLHRAAASGRIRCWRYGLKPASPKCFVRRVLEVLLQGDNVQQCATALDAYEEIDVAVRAVVTTHDPAKNAHVARLMTRSEVQDLPPN